MNIIWEKTDRGWWLGTFYDLYGKQCSVQESSLATDDAIWLGVDFEEGTRMHLNRDQAEMLARVLIEFMGSGDLEGCEKTLLVSSSWVKR